MAKPGESVVGERLCEVVAGFLLDPEAARKSLRDLLADDRTAFRTAALPALRLLNDGPGRSFLIELLADAGLLPACDPAIFRLEEEIALARKLAARDDSLDLKLARRFSGGAAPMTEDIALRTLAVLSSIADNGRVLPLVIRLLRHSNPRLRSKAALVIGRLDMAPQTAEHLSGEADPRVLANAVEALWGADTAKAHSALLDACDNPNQRVVGNALVGLFRIGDTSAIRRIPRLAAHPNPLFRATAAWVMERTDHPRFLPVLAAMVREPDPRARSRVFKALAALNRSAARFAAARPLRVHILGVSSEAAGLRTVRAAVATREGDESGVLPTGLVVSENSAVIEDFTVHRAVPPESMSLGLFLPTGDRFDRILASLSAMKRKHDRWSTVRYAPGAPLSAVLPVFAFLGAVSGARHALIHADELSDGELSPPLAGVISQARACPTAIHSVSLPGAPFAHGPRLAKDTGGACVVVKTADELGAAFEKIYLGLLHPYEVIYPAAGRAASEIKLEAYAPDGYGSDVFRLEPPS